MNDLVTVIIPMYNSEKYLRECLDSVIGQTYRNIEIIIINDGSTDNSLEISNSYREKDNRIQVYSNKNHGVSYTRNFGIEKAGGEYIAFIDSDDIIASDYIETMIYTMLKTGADCCMAGMQSFFKEYSGVLKTGQYDVKILSNLEMKRCIYELTGGGFITNKLYRKRIILENKLKLIENIHVCEDLLFNWKYFDFCEKVVYIEQPRYFYRIYASSSYNNIFNAKWYTVIDAYKLILQDDSLKTDAIIRRNVIYSYIMILIEAEYRLKKSNSNNLVLEMKIKEEREKYNSYISSFSVKQKIKSRIFSAFPDLVMFRRMRKMK